LAQKEIQLTRTTEGSALPGLTVGTANVVLHQPLEVDVAGDVGIDYDLYFANTGLSQITSEGPLKIAAGDSNAAENLTLTTGGSGDVIVSLSTSGQQFKVLHALSASTSEPFTIDSETTATSTPSGGLFRIISDVNSDENVVFKIDAGGNFYYDGTGSSPASDVAENYLVEDTSIEAGDVVVLSTNPLIVEKSTRAYQENLVGVISSKPALLMGGDLKKSRPVTLVGRVLVKVTTENGPIEVGDLLTSASSTPGTAMKATEPGRVIGIALEPFDGTTTQCSNSNDQNSTSSNSGICNLEFGNSLPIGKVMVFVNPHWSIGQLTEDGLLALNDSTTTTTASSSSEETSILDRFTLAVKRSLQKLGLFVEKGVAKVKELFARKVVTNQICLEDENGSTTCITKAELDKLLKERNLSGASGASCTPNWQCSEWSPLPEDVCAGESFTQTRICTDLNNCGADNGKPEETKNAIGTKDCSGNSGDSGGSGNDSGGGSGTGDDNNSGGVDCQKQPFYLDSDGDGFGDPNNSTSTCQQPAGYVTDNTDCDDNSSTTYPGAPEICDDGIDNDCDGKIDAQDENCPLDTDGDGVIDSEDACPETAGDFCNGCPQPECSGCQSPVCPETGKPICQDDNSLCQVLPNTDVVCQSGVCSYSCQEGYLDCNGDGTGSDADGCEFQKETATSTCP